MITYIIPVVLAASMRVSRNEFQLIFFLNNAKRKAITTPTEADSAGEKTPV